MKKKLLYIFATIGAVSTICSILWAVLHIFNPIQSNESEIYRIQSDDSEYDAVLTDTSGLSFGSPNYKIYLVPKDQQFIQGSKLFYFPVFENSYVRKQDICWSKNGNLIINNGQNSIDKFESHWYDPNNDFDGTKEESWKGVKIILETGPT